MKAAAILLVGAINIVLMLATGISLLDVPDQAAIWAATGFFALLFLATGWSLIEEGPTWLIRAALAGNFLCATLALALAVFTPTLVEIIGVLLAGGFHLVNVWALGGGTRSLRSVPAALPTAPALRRLGLR